MEHVHEHEGAAPVTVDERLRNLENWRAFVLGVTCAAGVILSALQGYVVSEIAAQRRLLHQVAVKVGVQIDS